MEERKKHKNGFCGCCRLIFAPIPANRPPAIDTAFWVQATARGEVCGEPEAGHIEIRAQGLIPLGVYTLWFLTDRGPFPAAPLDANYAADGFDPNRLVVNANGVLNYYIAPLDYNPFRGIPVPGGFASIQSVVITLNTNRTTNGLSPGTINVNAFDQLITPFCLPR